MGIKDVYIPAEYPDWKVSGPIEFRDSSIGDYTLEEGKRWAIVPVTFKGLWNKPAGGEATVGFGSLDASLRTEDGENIGPYIFARPGGFQDHWLLAKRDAIYSGSPDDGQEVTARMAFQISKDAKIGSLIVKQRDFRTIKFAKEQLTGK